MVTALSLMIMAEKDLGTGQRVLKPPAVGSLYSGNVAQCFIFTSLQLLASILLRTSVQRSKEKTESNQPTKRPNPRFLR